MIMSAGRPESGIPLDVIVVSGPPDVIKKEDKGFWEKVIDFVKEKVGDILDGGDGGDGGGGMKCTQTVKFGPDGKISEIQNPTHPSPLHLQLSSVPQQYLQAPVSDFARRGLALEIPNWDPLYFSVQIKCTITTNFIECKTRR